MSMSLQIGFIGLGKMGSRMVQHLIEEGFEVVVYARNPEAMVEVVQKGAVPTSSYGEFAAKLTGQKKIFLMVTQGEPVDEVLSGLRPFLSAGDIVIDGGNSFYKDSMRRAKALARGGVHFLDVGTSGGLEGARHGASLMIGGNEEAFKSVNYVFKALAVENGYAWVGSSGAGHFAKMVHNGIEYSFLQSLGEGYGLLRKSKFNFDLREVTKAFRNGSVIRGWLLDLLSRSLEKDPDLKGQSGVIGGGKTGEWALKTAKELKLKMPALEASMKARKVSQKKPEFFGKVVGALRFEFGGHEAPKKGK